MDQALSRDLNEDTGKDSNKESIKDTLSLAFLGDALYELYVREKLVSGNFKGADRLHKAAVAYVRAEAQAHAMKTLIDDLSEEELTLVKRARNKKIASRPKNVDPILYKWATAFEALLAHLYLSDQLERMKEIMEWAMIRTDEENGKKTE